jgi:hypothetical protein
MKSPYTKEKYGLWKEYNVGGNFHFFPKYLEGKNKSEYISGST